jgi:N-acetyl-alpha-D-muramate 1-phosphate uridylyltransferase
MMKAMIFAAGLGTRLRPLTDDRPKALVELAGRTLLQITVDTLSAAGASLIVINIHHFPEMMKDAVSKLKTRSEIIISDESDLLLDTGGGLLKAAGMLSGNEPVILHNVDIVSGIDLKEMYQNHQKSNALVTLAVSQRPSSRYFLWDNDRLCGWLNTKTGELKSSYSTDNEPLALAFSGIHIINPELLSMIDEKGVFSINKIYLRLAAQQKIVPYIHNSKYWADLGTPEKLLAAEKQILENPGKFNTF